MRPVTVRVAGIDSSDPVLLDYMIAPFQVSVGARVISGSVLYTLQYSYDDPRASGGIVNWLDASTMAGKTTTSDAVINAGPVTAVRIVNAGAGILVARIVQAGVAPNTTTTTASGREYTAGRMMEDALRRAGVTPEKYTSETTEIALDQLRLMFDEMMNLGIQLWARDRVILPLYERQNMVPTPSDTSVVISLNQRYLSRPDVASASTSAGGDASLAFDGDLATECAQTSPNGHIAAAYSEATVITTVGVLFGASATLILYYEYTTDGTTWETALTSDSTSVIDNEWVWVDIEGAPPALGWRVRASGDDDFVAREIYFGNNPTEIPMGMWNLDDWNAMVVKNTPGAPFNWYQQRDRVSPTLYIWPMPNDTCKFYQLIAWRRRYLTDVTAFTQTMDISRRWFEGLTASLARRFCRSIPEADMGRYGLLKGEEAESMALAMGEERDPSPMRYNPGLDVYTR